MPRHIDRDGRFQSDRHPDLPPDKIVLSFNDPLAHPALMSLSMAYHETDPELSQDIFDRLTAIRAKGTA